MRPCWRGSPMGNNAAFTDFEATVLATYNKGVLDKELLSTFMEQYRGVDIDRGGMTGDLAKDGSDIDDIILKMFGVPSAPRPDLPADHKTWTPEQEAINEKYWEDRYDAVCVIEKRFGWH